MREPLNGRRGSLVVIIALTLAAAVAGTTIAGQATTAKSGGLTSKQKKQVNKQIKKKAPKLRVKSAKDAKRVGGKTASELATTSAFAERKSDALLESEFQPVLDTSLQTKAGSRIIATASMHLFGGANAAQATCQITIGEETSSTFLQDISVVNGSSDGTMSLTFAASADPGTHDIEVSCREDAGAVEVIYTTLSAIEVPE